MSLSGKVVVLTGAASGMGLETAKLLGSKGVKLSMADVQEGPLKEAAAEIEKAGGTVMATVVNVTIRKQVEDWIKATVEKFGKIDGAANLAGVIGKQNNIASLQDIDDADWDFVLGVNTKGLLNCLRAQIPVRLSADPETRGCADTSDSISMMEHQSSTPHQLQASSVSRTTAHM